MPTLNWIGKDAVVKHHQDVPFHLLHPVPSLSIGGPATLRISSLAQPSGYTEPLLHAWRLKVKAAA